MVFQPAAGEKKWVFLGKLKNCYLGNSVARRLVGGSATLTAVSISHALTAVSLMPLTVITGISVKKPRRFQPLEMYQRVLG